MKPRTVLAVLLASVLGAGLTTSAGAANREGETKADYTQSAQIKVPGDAMGGIGSGLVDDWSDGTSRVLFNLEPDDLDGDLTDGTDSTPEWELIGRTGPCEDVTAEGGSGATLFHEPFVNTRVYGPRVLVFPESPPGGMVPALGSIALIHDGPTSTHHAIHQGYSGRHLVACVDAQGERVF